MQLLVVWFLTWSGVMNAICESISKSTLHHLAY